MSHAVLAAVVIPVWAHWAELPDREQQLLHLRFYGSLTQAEVGEQLGISQMHVSRLLGRALAYLGEHPGDTAPGDDRAPPALWLWPTEQASQRASRTAVNAASPALPS